MPAGHESNEHNIEVLFAQYFGQFGERPFDTEAQKQAAQRLQADFASEHDRGKRIALWLVLKRIGAAPRLKASFAHEDDRLTASVMADLMAIEGLDCRFTSEAPQRSIDVHSKH